MSGWKREVLRRVPVVGRDAAREYFEDIVSEPPPQTPTVPWTPQPPPWMVEPVPVYEAARGMPVQWVDEAPYKAWAERVGRARFELLKLDSTREEKKQLLADGLPAWAPADAGRRTPLQRLNHPSEALSRYEREKYNVPPWAGRSWLRETLKGRKGTAQLGPLPEGAEDKMSRESRDITCTVAPWWDE
ncbi:hypothetical protein ACWCYZ_39045 [Streptomyces virginiae]